jgi:hypothetical protein
LKKFAAFRNATYVTTDDIEPLKAVIEALIIRVMLNLAHAAHMGKVPPYYSPHDAAHNPSLAYAGTSCFGVLSAITEQHREILNRLVLWYVRGGGMQAAAAALAASFAQAQHFLPHRLIVGWQLQKNALSTQEVDFLQELVMWNDPSYVSEASSSSSLSSPAAAAALRLPAAPPLIQRAPLPVHQRLASSTAGAHQLPPCAIRLDPCFESL